MITTTTTHTNAPTSGAPTSAPTADVGQQPITRRARFALRAVYAAGFAGTGYGLWELFSGPGKMNVFAALGPVILIELFAVTASTYSTRARVRGEGGFFIRNVVVLGAIASGGMQFGFHIGDNPVIAIGLPIVTVLALILWVLDVRDQYAAIFRAQLEERQARRRERRSRAVRVLAYMYANGPRATLREWKDRTREIGSVSRDVDRQVVLAEINDRRPDALSDFDRQVFEITSDDDDRDDTDASADDTDGEIPTSPGVGPLPPRMDRPTVERQPERKVITARPISPAPGSTVTGDDDHARKMRKLPTATACVRYAWEVAGADA
jgi:hypothetical protein